MAIGDVITTPEIGWKRYDNQSASFKYTGSWSTGTVAGTGEPLWGGDMSFTDIPGAKVSFKFKGTKLRIMDENHPNRSTTNIITIDGEQYTYDGTAGTASNVNHTVVYENIGLNDTVHTVELIFNDVDGKFLSLDSIDIDDTGRLLHLDEVTDIVDLDIGNRIRCHYVASANSVGTFSGLGEESYVDGINDFIPVSSTSTPNGDFYFIMIEDWNSKKRLVADRNIQHSISWDTLNSKGIASGVGLPIDLDGSTDYDCTMRLLTGGIDATDTENEWDKYIVNSDLNGTITAGDSSFWGAEAIWSWTSTTPTSGSTYRTRRGYFDGATYNNLEAFNDTATSSGSNATIGFRPLLEIEIIVTIKYLFEDNGEIKKYDLTNGWVSLGASPATETMFIDNGMNSISYITDSELALLASMNPKVLYYTTETTKTDSSLNMSALPVPRLIMPVSDLAIDSFSSIDSVALTATQTGSGVVKMIVSMDSGSTWKTWNGSAWDTIDSSDLIAVRDQGMDATTISLISSTQWNTLRETSNTIRFAYYLEQSSMLDEAYTSEITLQADMFGTWKKAIHGTDYDYEYPSNVTLRVKLMSSGDFKINY